MLGPVICGIGMTLGGLLNGSACGLIQPGSEKQPETASVSAAASEKTLRAVWPVGEARRYRFFQQSSERTGAAENPDAAVERKGTMRIDVTMKAVAMADIPASLAAEIAALPKSESGVGPVAESLYSLTIDAVKFTAVTRDGIELVFDSAVPEQAKEENPFYPSVSPLVGTTVVFAVDAAGVVIAATGHENLIVIGSPSARIAVQLIEPTSIGVKFGPTLGFFSEGAKPELAAAWSRKRSVPYVPGIVLEVTDAVTVESIEGTIATVAAKGTPELRIPNPGRLGKREIKSSDIHSTITWNVAKGALLKCDSVLSTDVLLISGVEGAGSRGLVQSRVESTLESIE